MWNVERERLHWVDILRGTIHTSNLSTAETHSMTVPTLVGAAHPRCDSGFVAATAEGFALVSATGILDTRLPILPADSRMNDAKCDARGRLWAGSTRRDFHHGSGALHVLHPDFSTHVVLEGLTLPNGMGWSNDGATFYLIDSIEATLSAYAFDPHTSELGSARVVRRFDAADGTPDGLAVDDADRLWIACWGAGRVVCIAPTGEQLLHVPVPVRQPSSCAFVGADLGQLAVTSAREGLGNLTAQSLDGSVLIIDGLNAAGQPTNTFGG